MESMMRKDLTDVTLIVDRSGSMMSCKDEAEHGVNFFIEEQKKQPGECLFSLAQFDFEYEMVHRGLDIKVVPPYKLVPRGGTALLDAVGRTINEIGDRLEKLPEDQRPGLVIVVITTDGYENISREFTKTQIKNMIEHQQKKYAWQFTFLGANQDAFAEGRSLGIATNSIANYAPNCTRQMYAAAASNVTRMRAASLNGLKVECAYSDAERTEMNNEN